MDFYNVQNFVLALSNIYQFMMIAYILLSWLPNARDSFIGVWLGKLVEPYLGLFRRIIPPIGGMLDISPILAFFVFRYLVIGLMTVIGWLFGAG